MISSLELAKLCGVSQGTVDRAIHGRPGVSAATRDKILAMAAEHGYRPHPAAKELLSGKSNILGMLVPAMNSVFFMDFMQVVKEACDDFGLRLFISPVADKVEFIEALDDFAARRVRAILAIPPEENIQIPAHLVNSLPIATLISPCENDVVPFFAPNEQFTGVDAAAYLADKGHRRILHVTYHRQACGIIERQAGYVSEMTSRGLQPKVCVFSDLLSTVASYQPTAIFCHNDWLAIRVMRALQENGVSVPGDVSILGVDNSPTFNRFQSDITTMTYPMAEIAQKSVRWLAEGVDERPISRLQIAEKSTVINVKKGKL
ncbi:MAG: LacI family DNA-binding transcriptional regulator [bacterium]